MTRTSILTYFLFISMGTASLAQDTPSVSTPDVWERFQAAAAADKDTMRYFKRWSEQLKRQEKSAVLRELLSSFYKVAPDGALTAGSVERARQTGQAKQRAQVVSQYLSWDLNSDGTLSQQERELVDTRQRAEIDVLFMEGDRDANGNISVTEMIAFANSQLATRRRGRSEFPFMLFDSDANGTVTVEEIAQIIDLMAAQQASRTNAPNNRSVGQNTQNSDTSSPIDGLTDEDVTRNFLNKGNCQAPQPSDDAQVVVLSGYEGTALSTVSVAGMDGVTHVGRLIIEPGKKPLYLYLTAYANMIWDITGATDRVAALVVQKGISRDGAGAGVVGIDSKKVHFSDRGSCSPAYIKVSGGEGMIAYQKIAKSIGRDPDVVLHSYSIGSMSVPSGAGSEKATEESGDVLILNGRRYEMKPEGPRLMDETEGQLPDAYPFGATRTHKSMLRFSPDGILSIEPEGVVAPAPVVSYDVMPQQAGLLQLILEKRIRYTRDGFFVIEKPIERFPAGLAGAHSVKFILAEGIEMPGGNAGHSSVYSAETGECLSRMCMR